MIYGFILIMVTILPSGDIEYDTTWKTHSKKSSQVVRDQYIVSQKDVDDSRLFWKISAKPTDDINSIRVYINDKRNKTFSFARGLCTLHSSHSFQNDAKRNEHDNETNRSKTKHNTTTTTTTEQRNEMNTTRNVHKHETTRNKSQRAWTRSRTSWHNAGCE